MDNEKAAKGPPGGRPRKDTRKLRDEWLKARVTADELHLVEQWAREANMTPSDYIRSAALKAPITIRRYRAPDPAVISQLQRIGNNINQIARICNTTGNDRRATNLELFLSEDLRPVLKILLKQYAP
jgi:hypothetical protein